MKSNEDGKFGGELGAASETPRRKQAGASAGALASIAWTVSFHDTSAVKGVKRQYTMQI